MTRIPIVGLTAGLLALVLSPAFYLAVGIRQQFSAPLGFLLMAAVVVASSYLSARWMSKPDRTTSAVVCALEGVAALVVLAFTVLAPQGVFISSSRRIPLAFTVFAAAWLLCLPLPLLRKTTLERRLSKLPHWLLAAALLALVATSLTFVYLFISRPEHLI